jgi:hypothetical protein
MDGNRGSSTDVTNNDMISRFFRTMMTIPSETYFTVTVGSIVASLLFYVMGKRHTALFVGEWAPTLLVAALFYKLLHPTNERVGERMGQAINEFANR